MWVATKLGECHWGGEKGKVCQAGRVVVFLRFYVFIFRERGREGERGRETLMCERTLISCFSHDTNQRPGLQPRHVP